MIAQVSTSALKVLSTCETQFVVRYVLGYDGSKESAIARAGTDAHKAWAAYFKGHSVKSSLKIFQDSYEDWSLDPENYIDERLSYDNVAANLKVWFDRHPWSRLPFKPDPELVEVVFNLPLDSNGDFLFAGTLDLCVEELDQPTHTVVDHKTTRSITEWFDAKFVNGAQGTGYVAAARYELKDPTINRFYVNALSFKKLNMEYKKCSMPAHKGMNRADCWPEHVEMKILGPYERNEEQINDWLRTARRVAKRFPYYYDLFAGIAAGSEKLTQQAIHSLKTEGALQDACRFCALQKWCANGRPAHAIGRFLQKRKPGGTQVGVWGMLDEDEQ